ncbi:MAG: 3-oxoacyl-ACP reductase FabG [Steroidobacteraceae bacterium]
MAQAGVLEGKVALVTGASRGIGQAIALELGALGATVVGTATSEAGAASISEYLAARSIKGRGLVLDVASPESCDAALQGLESAEGSPSILVNNAGITRDNLLLRMKPEEWQQVLDTNLSGAFRLAKGTLRGMLKARWGRVINIASVVGLIGNPGQANYAAAKAGLIGFSRAMAREVASRGVTVNVVAPGFIETDMTHALAEEQKAALASQIPLGRLGSPGDVAAAVAFLAGPGADWITGETINVNGGMHMP